MTEDRWLFRRHEGLVRFTQSDVAGDRVWGTVVLRDLDGTTLTVSESPSRPISSCVVPKELLLSKVRSVPYLRSAWQKATRRGLVGQAVRLALTLFHLDPQAFLRRLPVVAVEDALPHPFLPRAVWLMVAQCKGRPVDESDLDCLMSVVAACAASPYRDALVFAESQQERRLFVGQHSNIASLGDDLSNALVVRASYGGTQGDTAMIRCAARIWRSRLSDSRSIEWMKILAEALAPIDWKHMAARVTDDECLLREGADFHCFPTVTKDVARACGLYDVESVRRAIWFWSSGRTLKTMISNPDDPSKLVLDGVVDRERELGLAETRTTWRTIETEFQLASDRLVWLLETEAAEPEETAKKRKSSSSQAATLEPGKRTKSSPQRQASILSYFRPQASQ